MKTNPFVRAIGFCNLSEVCEPLLMSNRIYQMRASMHMKSTTILRAILFLKTTVRMRANLQMKSTTTLRAMPLLGPELLMRATYNLKSNSFMRAIIPVKPNFVVRPLKSGHFFKYSKKVNGCDKK